MTDQEKAKLEQVALKTLENLAESAADEGVRLEAAQSLARILIQPW